MSDYCDILVQKSRFFGTKHAEYVYVTERFHSDDSPNARFEKKGVEAYYDEIC